MTVKELKEYLADKDDDKEVLFKIEYEGLSSIEKDNVIIC